MLIILHIKGLSIYTIYSKTKKPKKAKNHVITMKKRKDKEIEIGLKEEDVYSEEGREAALEDDTITDLEEGFLQGYEENERPAKCATGKIVQPPPYLASSAFCGS